MNSLFEISEDGTLLLSVKDKSIKEAVIPHGITAIGSAAFMFCRELQLVRIPDSVIFIGDAAFYDCRMLRHVYIPSNVEHIGRSAFRSCNLRSIDVAPDNAVYRSVDGVLYNKSLTELVCFPSYSDEKIFTVPNTVTTIGEFGFEMCALKEVHWPGSVKVIGNNSFSASRFLEKVYIHGMDVCIGDNSFCDCCSLQYVYVCGSVSRIGKCTFYNCHSLKNECLMQEAETVGDECFAWCSSLREANIPKTLTSIGFFVFINCVSLQYINVELDNPVYTSVAGVLYDKRTETLICFPQNNDCVNYAVPEGVRSIYHWAFANNMTLRTIEIPDTIISIGANAFRSCRLTEIHFVSGNPLLMRIDNRAFKGVDLDNCRLCVPAYACALYCSHPILGRFRNIVAV